MAWASDDPRGRVHSQENDTTSSNKNKILHPHMDTSIRSSKGRCATCHTPHGGKGPKLWAHELTNTFDGVRSLCYSCHDGSFTVEGIEHYSVSGSKNVFEMMNEGDPNHVVMKYGNHVMHGGADIERDDAWLGPYDPNTFPLDSHDEDRLPQDPNLEKYRKGGSGFYCGSCHNVHKDPNGYVDHDYLRTKEKSVGTAGKRRDFCIQCHDPTISKIPYHSNLDKNEECLNCHNPHKGETLLKINEERGRKILIESWNRDDPDVCKKCHHPFPSNSIHAHSVPTGPCKNCHGYHKEMIWADNDIHCKRCHINPLFSTLIDTNFRPLCYADGNPGHEVTTDCKKCHKYIPHKHTDGRIDDDELSMVPHIAICGECHLDQLLPPNLHSNCLAKPCNECHLGTNAHLCTDLRYNDNNSCTCCHSAPISITISRCLGVDATLGPIYSDVEVMSHIPKDPINNITTEIRNCVLCHTGSPDGGEANPNHHNDNAVYLKEGMCFHCHSLKRVRHNPNCMDCYQCHPGRHGCTIYNNNNACICCHTDNPPLQTLCDMDLSRLNEVLGININDIIPHNGDCLACHAGGAAGIAAMETGDETFPLNHGNGISYFRGTSDVCLSCHIDTIATGIDPLNPMNKVTVHLPQVAYQIPYNKILTDPSLSAYNNSIFDALQQAGAFYGNPSDGSLALKEFSEYNARFQILIAEGSINPNLCNTCHPAVHCNANFPCDSLICNWCHGPTPPLTINCDAPSDSTDETIYQQHSLDCADKCLICHAEPFITGGECNPQLHNNSEIFLNAGGCIICHQKDIYSLNPLEGTKHKSPDTDNCVWCHQGTPTNHYCSFVPDLCTNDAKCFACHGSGVIIHSCPDTNNPTTHSAKNNCNHCHPGECEPLNHNDPNQRINLQMDYNWDDCGICHMNGQEVHKKINNITLCSCDYCHKGNPPGDIHPCENWNFSALTADQCLCCHEEDLNKITTQCGNGTHYSKTDCFTCHNEVDNETKKNHGNGYIDTSAMKLEWSLCDNCHNATYFPDIIAHGNCESKCSACHHEIIAPNDATLDISNHLCSKDIQYQSNCLCCHGDSSEGEIIIPTITDPSATVTGDPIQSICYIDGVPGHEIKSDCIQCHTDEDNPLYHHNDDTSLSGMKANLDPTKTNNCTACHSDTIGTTSHVNIDSTECSPCHRGPILAREHLCILGYCANYYCLACHKGKNDIRGDGIPGAPRGHDYLSNTNNSPCPCVSCHTIDCTIAHHSATAIASDLLIDGYSYTGQSIDEARCSCCHGEPPNAYPPKAMCYTMFDHCYPNGNCNPAIYQCTTCHSSFTGASDHIYGTDPSDPNGDIVMKSCDCHESGILDTTHEKHFTTSIMPAGIINCDTCHYEAGHKIDCDPITKPTGGVSFNPNLIIISPLVSYYATDPPRCNIYCHSDGDNPPGGVYTFFDPDPLTPPDAKPPTWDQSAINQCSTGVGTSIDPVFECHGTPPVNPHPAGGGVGTCTKCHPTPIGDGTPAPLTHINGITESDKPGAGAGMLP